MRIPLVIEMVDAQTLEVEWAGSVAEMREANMGDEEVVKALARIQIAWKMGQPLPPVHLGGGATVGWILRVRK